MAESVKMPSPDSLMNFHQDVSSALGALQEANPGITTPVLCGSALQLMLNFPHTWMGQSGTVEKFVETITLQAQQFVDLKEKSLQAAGIGKVE